MVANILLRKSWNVPRLVLTLLSISLFLKEAVATLKWKFRALCITVAIHTNECFFLQGNYGNKLDQSVPPSSSTTPPTNAVYDGCYYYYLPWGDTKPCVCVDSHWEDISFRLDNLNILTRLCERLVSMNQSGVVWLAFEYQVLWTATRGEDWLFRG